MPNYTYSYLDPSNHTYWNVYWDNVEIWINIHVQSLTVHSILTEIAQVFNNKEMIKV